MANRPYNSFLKSALTCFLGGMLCSLSFAADRVEVIKTEIDRTEVKFSRIDTENFELNASVGLISIEDFDVGFIANLRAAFHLNEHLFIEASYGESEGDRTSFEELSAGLNLLTDDEREYNTWDVSLGVNIFPGETWLFGRAFSSDMYIVLGAGKTNFGDRDWSTINIGAGYRFFINDWLATRLEVRDHIFNRNLFGIDKRTHNIEMSLSLSYFF